MREVETQPVRRSSIAIVCAAAAGLLLLVSGCQSPWVVIQSAEPNPLQNQKQFGLQSVEMKEVMVDDRTEENFKSTKNPDQLKNWEGDKAAIKELFSKALIDDAAQQGITISPMASNGLYTIEPTVMSIDNGYYTIPAWNAISRIKMRVRIKGPGGKVLDEIVIQNAQPFDAITAAATGTRLRNIAEALGHKCAKYLAKRVSG